MFKKEQLKKLIIPVSLLTLIDGVLATSYFIDFIGGLDYPIEFDWSYKAWKVISCVMDVVPSHIFRYLLICLGLNLIFALICWIFHKPIRLSRALIWLSFVPFTQVVIVNYL